MIKKTHLGGESLEAQCATLPVSVEGNHSGQETKISNSFSFLLNCNHFVFTIIIIIPVSALLQYVVQLQNKGCET